MAFFYSKIDEILISPLEVLVNLYVKKGSLFGFCQKTQLNIVSIR